MWEGYTRLGHSVGHMRYGGSKPVGAACSSAHSRPALRSYTTPTTRASPSARAAATYSRWNRLEPAGCNPFCMSETENAVQAANTFVCTLQ